MTVVSLDDKLVADAVRATGLHQKDKAIEEMVRLQLQLKGQKEAIQELWGSFQWQGDLQRSRLSRDPHTDDDDRR